MQIVISFLEDMDEGKKAPYCLQPLNPIMTRRGFFKMLPPRRAQGMAQVAEYLPSECKALSSTSSTTAKAKTKTKH
jgi:hypothetical protein